MGKKVTIDFSKVTGEEKDTEKTHKKPRKKAKKKVIKLRSDGKPDLRRRNEYTVSEVLNRRQKKSAIYTKSGHQLTVKEAKFIDSYIADGNGRQAVIRAGYEFNKSEDFASQLAHELLRKPYIADEIQARMESSKSQGIADRQEIMQFFTDMMRGKILDQFDLPTTNGDKIKAACELAKRSIDFEDRIKEKAKVTAPEVKISLKWEDKNGEQK